MKDIFEHYLMGERVYTHAMQPVCEKHALTYTELTVIMFLANNPSLDTASDLVKCRNIAKSHVSVSVRSLEERGLITKTYRDGNRKSLHLTLTELAEVIVKDGRAAQRSFGELIFDGVTDDERAVMNSIFKKIDSNLKKFSEGAKKTNAG